MRNKSSFLKKKCLPCEGGVRPLTRKTAVGFLKVFPDWRLSKDGKSISAEYLMKNFMAAIRFINRIAQIAESQDHHPDIHLTGYRKLRIELSTHAINGLSENDFILAARIDRVQKKLKKS